MTAIPQLTDPAAATAALTDLALGAGAQHRRHVHPVAGPDGQPVATDVFRFGAPVGRAERVVLLNSGLHGVEGHAGNGIQRRLVESGRLASLADGLAVVLVHAINPHGFARSRRVDLENIDVNRNFVDYEHLPSNPMYAEVDGFLNPDDEVLDIADLAFLADLSAFWERVGDDRMMRTLNGGQYEWADGVQYGGDHASWSRRMLDSMWSEQLVGAATALQLDVHTGLGPLGRLTVFQTADPDEPAAELGASLYPEHIYRADRTDDDPVDHGLLGPGFDAWAEGRGIDTATFVLEFGTHDPVRGITAFRADNWLHHHGDPDSELGREISAMMLDQFFVRDGDWREQVGEQGERAVLDALDALG